MLVYYLFSVFSLLCSSFALQTSLALDKSTTGDLNGGLFALYPKSLSLLSHDHFEIFDHPLYPEHSVRIKKTDFCDDTVRYEPYRST